MKGLFKTFLTILLMSETAASLALAKADAWLEVKDLNAYGDPKGKISTFSY